MKPSAPGLTVRRWESGRYHRGEAGQEMQLAARPVGSEVACLSQTSQGAVQGLLGHRVRVAADVVGSLSTHTGRIPCRIDRLPRIPSELVSKQGGQEPLRHNGFSF